MITITDLAAELGMSSDPEKVALFVGAFAENDTRTGRLAKRWAGQGMEATFTRDEADELIAEWDRHATYAEAVAYLSGDPEDVAVAERYQP
ncbi:hypothetical protein [Micromonospora sp. DT227]|uniref:hypothetical protein n=1 Tax=Micromonospora sp. DT227 TaxID=3393433 RepID=UPI003CF02AE8